MKYQELLRALRPVKFGTFNVESFDLYKERASVLLPDWPECPLKNWLYRHFDFFIDDYAWLRVDRFKFSLASWTNGKIYQHIGTHKLNMVDNLGEQVLKNPPSLRSWLQEYFLSEGTWPTPIIVLKNYEGIVGMNGEIYGQPFHLLEGHLRLGYFRNIYRYNPQNLKKDHPVWLVSLTKPSVSRDKK